MRIIISLENESTKTTDNTSFVDNRQMTTIQKYFGYGVWYCCPTFQIVEALRLS